MRSILRTGFLLSTLGKDLDLKVGIGSVLGIAKATQKPFKIRYSRSTQKQKKAALSGGFVTTKYWINYLRRRRNRSDPAPSRPRPMIEGSGTMSTVKAAKPVGPAREPGVPGGKAPGSPVLALKMFDSPAIAPRPFRVVRVATSHELPYAVSQMRIWLQRGRAHVSAEGLLLLLLLEQVRNPSIATACTILEPCAFMMSRH